MNDALDARNVKRSLSIAGHRTSISLEEPFWRALKDIATQDGVSLAALVARIDGERKGVGLSSALRLHVLRMLQAKRA
ncbi:ribbon-helix-helix domain-containing protein [Terrarubrum flagellatum]|uniref:ribbon-helix-helix domain-containing protein n=1 Tax=Terrirubrum flagellatum TaxID=2895980 RepID=UPI003145038A